jgi:type IV pilus assembly protein PilM
MASAGRGIWAIDIGNNSLKALHLRAAGEKLEVIGFDNIEHGRILSSGNLSDTEKSEMIAASLRRFVEQNDVGKDEVFISVAGQTSFARFIKLPPVEPKRIPEIVKFEAVQQIPFDINEVEWDWQVMEKPDSPDVEVGIFAIKNEVISGILDYFSRENLKVTGVQMAPIALYNFATYERGAAPEGDKSAVIVMDMGAENTDLVICTKAGVWQRSVPLGGNAFTKAVAGAFKLDFEKAEKLKRTAPMSKYARQIFQSMKPVFSDLAAELQRSLGFYGTSNRDVKFQKVIALGGGMKMQGLIKFLQQTISLPIVRPDAFERIDVAQGVSAAKFHDNVADFGVVYGLAVQGLGLAKIQSNLLPRKIERAMTWTRKANYFTVAASVLFCISLLALGRAMVDKSSYIAEGKVRDETKAIVNKAELAARQLEQETARNTEYDAAIGKQMALFKYRDVVPLLNESLVKCLPGPWNVPKPEQKQAELYSAFMAGNAEKVKQILPRIERKQLFVTRLSIRYSDNLAAEGFEEGTMTSRSSVTVPMGGMSPGMPPGMMPGLPPGMMPGAPGMAPGGNVFYPPTQGGHTQSQQQTAGAGESAGVGGFVVTIEGYGPYRNINELLDPPGVSNNEAKWGMVTRMENLAAVCPNSPFKLYGKKNLKDFSVVVDEVDATKPMPAGIGVEKTDKQLRTYGAEQRVIVDPMTEEVISKEPEVDSNGKPKVDRFGKPLYRVNDHWFRINAKFEWNKEEKKEETAPANSKQSFGGPAAGS